MQAMFCKQSDRGEGEYISADTEMRHKGGKPTQAIFQRKATGGERDGMFACAHVCETVPESCFALCTRWGSWPSMGPIGHMQMQHGFV